MLESIRKKTHPIHALRKTAIFRLISKKLRVSLPIRFPDIDHVVYVDIMRNLSWVLSSGRSIEQEERRNFRAIVEAFGVRTFWDVGANIGLYTFIHKTIRKDGEAVVFEPDKRNIELLNRTVNSQRITDVMLIKKAVSSQAGDRDFYVDSITGATGSLVKGIDGKVFIERHFGEKTTKIHVGVTTLDHELQNRTCPNMLKIDVEGAEYDVLCGAEVLITKCKPLIMFEVSSDEEKILNTLKGYGYNIYDMTNLQLSENAIAHNNIAIPSTADHETMLQQAIRNTLS